MYYVFMFKSLVKIKVKIESRLYSTLYWYKQQRRHIILIINIGGEVFEHVDSDVHADSRDSQEMALRTADKLLKVKNKVYSDNQKTLE